ncbi:hypothetical protein AVEN_268346-1 [Araneus ventricosus]|uniref:Uncharacterized protein n=1 Tax=Araneus ventricosus TaxID=182803 RepID=A0A4Y2MUL3_ARAVE|nr:hypothetical protein AVEN_268346-1 [Araneus ventricosus]
MGIWRTLHQSLSQTDSTKLEKGMIIGFPTNGGIISKTTQFLNCSRAAVHRFGYIVSKMVSTRIRIKLFISERGCVQADGTLSGATDGPNEPGG